MYKLTMAAALALGAMMSVAACGSSTPGTTILHEAEQSGTGTCPTSPTILTGTAAEGATCKSAEDCSPTCCSCASGTTGQWLAAECVNNACKAANACADTEEAKFCK
jgi:hypothetical protein